MKIQVASDVQHKLHLARGIRSTLVTPNPEADLLVLAGDIGNGVHALDLFRDWPCPILFIAGYHEFYRQEWPSGFGVDPEA